MPRGCGRPRHILPFDHRSSCRSGLSGWKTDENALARIADRYREFTNIFERN